MEKNNSIYNEYFNLRNIKQTYYEEYKIPMYLRCVLPVEPHAKILDIGCGFGQMIQALKKEGYSNLKGVDISDEAIDYCLKQGLEVIKITDLRQFCVTSGNKYDFIIMSHVLEHLDKSTIIDIVGQIKNNLMNQGASLLVVAPNAQSNTGCYWAYEDFTHTTLFTAGSLYFVLKAAGFESVEFLDPDGLTYSRPIIKQLRKFFLFIYKMNVGFWNMVTDSSFHRPSPQIFTYEIKAIAK